MTIINKILARLFLYAKYKALEIEEENRRKEISKLAIIGEGTIINSESIIQNQTNNPDNIIVGKNSWIRAHLQIHNLNSKIIIGDNVFIGEHSKIWCEKRIFIGNNVLISHNVNIHDNNSHPLNSNSRINHFLAIKELNLIPNNFNLEGKEIIIKDDAWIGFNAIILKGVTIGKGAIIGAGAIITKDVPDFAVVVGFPQKIVKYTI